MRYLPPRSRQALLLIAIIASLSAANASEPKPDEIVARHLDAIASASTRAAVKTRVVEGTLKFRVVVGGSGGGSGTWDWVSSGRMLNVVMRFGMGDWLGEQFICDGSKTDVAKATAKHVRSEFGQFIANEDFLLKENLLGGELSTGWALQNLQSNSAHVEYLGLKKVHGKQLVGLQYFSKHSSDMQIKIYFDPETYRHVLTIYSLEETPAATGDIRTSSRQREIRYTLEENFDNFQTIEGITLPRHYLLQWTEELQSGFTRMFEWDFTANLVRDGVPLDPANFQVP